MAAKAKAKAKKSAKKSAGARRALKPAATRKTAPKAKESPKAAPCGPGTFCWNELMTTDVAGAKAFYGGLFGWKTQDMSMPGLDYSIWQRGADGAGGLMKHPMPGPGAPPAWLSYVHVENVDASAAKVPGLGGRVVVPPQDIPNMGRFAVAIDPQGASFAMFQPKMG